jgi:DNA-binding GntR family transcriptional regulator
MLTQMQADGAGSRSVFMPGGDSPRQRELAARLRPAHRMPTAGVAFMSTLTAVEIVDRRLLHTQVAERLRELIVWGDLEPGDRLNERVLCERFDISRTPLREALRILSTEGLVSLLPNRGAIVRRLTLAEAEDLFQLMAVLEGLAGELAARRATEEDMAAIVELHEQLRQHHRSRELLEYFKVNQRIHQSIIDCAGNAELASFYSRASVRLRRARYMANFSSERWDQAMREHEQIIEFLIARDGAKLKALLRQHLENKFDAIRSWLAEAR